MIRVYVAGPLHGSGKELENIKEALRWGQQLWHKGVYPFVPHLFSFWNYLYPHDGQKWLELDFAWLDVCDGLLRLPGDSPGSDAEVARMTSLGRPVWSTAQFEDLLHWAGVEERRLANLGIRPDPHYGNGAGKGWVLDTPMPGISSVLKGQMLPRVCTDPDKMNGVGDVFPGSDFPCTD